MFFEKVHQSLTTSFIFFFMHVTFCIPMTITSVRFVPNMRLVYLPTVASLPLPYNGSGLITGHSLISYTNLS